MILAYLRAAKREYSSLFAPVTTILPEAKMSAVVLGSRMRIMTAAKRLGLYSALRACKAIVFKSNLQSKFTVATMFLQKEEIRNDSSKAVGLDFVTVKLGLFLKGDGKCRLQE